MTIAQRVHRRPNDALPLPSWTAGALAGRAEIQVATAIAPTARWWSVRFEPITQEWGGQAYGGAQTIQTADTWARVRFADGESSPLYVSWPTLGGVLHVCAQQLNITALPLVSSMLPAADGPSWGVFIEDEPLSRTGREDWVGLQLTPDGGSPFLAGDILTYLLPPYARAVNIRQGSVLDPAQVGALVAVEEVGPTGLSLQGQTFSGGGRMVLGPRAQILSVVNLSAVDITLSVFVEVAL